MTVVLLHPVVRLVLAVSVGVMLSMGCSPAAMATEPDCAAALASPGVRWDDIPMESFTWAATEVGIQEVGSFDSQPAVVCVASGPPDRLPLQNWIGCLLVGTAVAETTDDKLMCGAFLSLEHPDDGLLWVAHSSAATISVTGFVWNGSRFELNVPTYEACNDDPLRPVQDSRECAPG
jgi:hypothetical protein